MCTKHTKMYVIAGFRWLQSVSNIWYCTTLPPPLYFWRVTVIECDERNTTSSLFRIASAAGWTDFNITPLPAVLVLGTQCLSCCVLELFGTQTPAANNSSRSSQGRMSASRFLFWEPLGIYSRHLGARASLGAQRQMNHIIYIFFKKKKKKYQSLISLR